MSVTQDDVIFETLSSTNERLMRECQEFLSSVDKSNVQAPAQTSAAGPRPPPQSTASSVDPRQQPQNNCGVIFERSAEDCGNKSGRINEAKTAEDYDKFDMKLQSIDNTIDTALNNLQTQSQQPAEYEYYNDPKYQRKTRGHSIDDDSLVAMAKRLDDAVSIMSDPSVICGTSEKKFPLISNQPHNRKSSAKSFLPEKTKRSGNRGERSTHSSRRSSNGSSASSSSSKLPRNERVQSSYPENIDNKSQPPIPRTHCKDNGKGTYIKRAGSRQSMPPPPPKEYGKRVSGNNKAESVHGEQVDLESRRKRSPTPAHKGYAQTIPPRAPYSDFRSRSNSMNSSQDFDTDDEGEDSDHTEFFYESIDDDDDDSIGDEYDPRAVGSSVADAVKDLNNQRGLKRVMKLFGKKSKGDEDMWSVATQR